MTNGEWREESRPRAGRGAFEAQAREAQEYADVGSVFGRGTQDGHGGVSEKSNL